MIGNTLQTLINGELERRNVNYAVRVVLGEWENAFQDGEGYEYPRMRTVLIEARSNWKLNETADGRILREGSVTARGYEIADLVARVADEVQNWQDWINAREQAHQSAASRGMEALETTSNQYIDVTPETAKAIGPVDQVLFQVHRADGSKHGWIVCDAREAINQELRYYHRNPSPIVSVVAVPDTDGFWADKRGTK